MTRSLLHNNQNLSIYIDTNVLRNFFTGQKADVECLRYVFSVRRKERLFTSTFAVGQVLSGLQKSNSKRHGFSHEQTIETGKYISQKFTLIDFVESDMYNSLLLDNVDIEDNIHYFLSQKKKCNIIITNDIKGFSYFYNILVIKPEQLSYLHKYVN
jgi:predicted nucleic acid-binding protein